MGGLNNQLAVVTGASSGIGESIACALAGKGVNLCLLGRDESRLQRTSAQISEHHSGVQIYSCDLMSAENIHSVATQITDAFPGIDLSLIHISEPTRRH